MRYQRRILALVVMLLIATSLMPGKWASVVTDGPRDLMILLLRPMGWLRYIGVALRGDASLPERPVSNEILMRDRDEAMRLNSELRARLEQAYRQIEQLSLVRQMGLPKVQLRTASVVEWTVGSTGPLMTIDCGRRQGVEEKMVVVQGVHLVGKVIHTSAESATVQPITTMGTHLAVRVYSSRPAELNADHPVLQIVASKRGGFIARADAGEIIAVDDRARLHDMTWPKEGQGFVVGVVTRIAPDEEDPILRREVQITPAMSIAGARDVVVVIPQAGTEGDAR